MIELLCKRADWRVYTASDTDDLLHILQDFSPEIIFADYGTVQESDPLFWQELLDFSRSNNIRLAISVDALINLPEALKECKLIVKPISASDILSRLKGDR